MVGLVSPHCVVLWGLSCALQASRISGFTQASGTPPPSNWDDQTCLYTLPSVRWGKSHPCGTIIGLGDDQSIGSVIRMKKVPVENTHENIKIHRIFSGKPFS